MKLVLSPLPPHGSPVPRTPAVPVDKPVVLFGRHPECDAVPRGTAKVSRRHCCVVEAGGRLRVRDLGSLNGTFVNGKRVLREAPLALGDVLRVGDVPYRLTRQGAAAPPPPPPAPANAATGAELETLDPGEEADSSDVVPASDAP